MRSTTDPGPLQRTGGSGRSSGHRPYRQIGQREASDAWLQWTWLDELNVASSRHCTWLDEDVVVVCQRMYMHSTRGPLQVVHYSNLGPLHRRIHYSRSTT